MALYDEFKLSIDANNNITSKLITHQDVEKKEKAEVITEGLTFDFINGCVQKLKDNKNLDAQDLILLGNALYEAIFPGPIGKQFEEALSDVFESHLKGDKDVQIRLIIDADPLSVPAKWPLEFLRCKNVLGGKWLATERDLIALSRRLILEKKFPPEPAYPPIQALIIVSKPNELSGVMAAPTLREISAMTAAQNTGPTTRAKMEVKVLGMPDKIERVEGLSYFDRPATYANIQELTVEERWYPHHSFD